MHVDVQNLENVFIELKIIRKKEINLNRRD